jgi:hypothetical protein
MDHQANIEYLNDVVKTFAKEAKDFEAEAEQVVDPDREECLRAYEANSRQHANTAQTEKIRAEQFDRSFGKIYASSGRRTVINKTFTTHSKTGEFLASPDKTATQFLLDWCLLDIFPNRGMVNRLPNQLIHRLDTSHPALMPRITCREWRALNINGAHIFRDEVNIGMYGRTSGYAFGKINPIPVIINPAQKESGSKESKAHSFTIEDCPHALAVVPYRSESWSSDKGDLGSIIQHTHSREWLGLLCGQTMAQCALFTPIDMVFRDIENVTGLEVVEPYLAPEGSV